MIEGSPETATKRKILITGCGRSGTKYTAMLLRALGMDIEHEGLGADGAASWFMAAESDSAPYGPGAKGIRFQHVFHQVRHPLAVIPSLQSFEKQSWDFIARHIALDLAEPLLLRCARYWLHWNELAEQKATWRYRIEDFDDVFQEFCARLDIEANRRILDQIPRNINTRPQRYDRMNYRFEMMNYRQRAWKLGWIRRVFLKLAPAPTRSSFTWTDLESLDRSLCQRIRSQAAAYGYEA